MDPRCHSIHLDIPDRQSMALCCQDIAACAVCMLQDLQEQSMQ